MNLDKRENELMIITFPTGKRQNIGTIKKVKNSNSDVKLDFLPTKVLGKQKESVRNARIPSKKAIIKRKRRFRRVMIARTIFAIVVIIIIILLASGIKKIISFAKGEKTSQVQNVEGEELSLYTNNPPEYVIDYIPLNEYSRPGTALNEVKNIFIHYTGNIGTTGWQNRSYFKNLSITKETSASAHFVIGYEGEIIQCIPFDEMAYAVIGRNEDSISIECCYTSEDGEFTEETYQSVIELTAWLLIKYNLSTEDVMRHFDATGKECPKYYVDNPEAWDQLIVDLTNYMKTM